MPPISTSDPTFGHVLDPSTVVGFIALAIVALALLRLRSHRQRHKITAPWPVSPMESNNHPDSSSSDFKKPSSSLLSEPLSPSTHEPYEHLFLPLETAPARPTAISSGDIVRVLSLPALTVRRRSYPSDQDGTLASSEVPRQLAAEAEPPSERHAEKHTDTHAERETAAEPQKDARREAESQAERQPARRTYGKIFHETTAGGSEIQRRDIVTKKDGTRRHVRVFEVGGGREAFGRMGTW